MSDPEHFAATAVQILADLDPNERPAMPDDATTYTVGKWGQTLPATPCPPDCSCRQPAVPRPTVPHRPVTFADFAITPERDGSYVELSCGACDWCLDFEQPESSLAALIEQAEVHIADREHLVGWA